MHRKIDSLIKQYTWCINMHRKIDSLIKQADGSADKAVGELTKTPPNWSQAYEYIMMIGSRMSEAVDAVYSITNDEELRAEYMLHIKKENDRIKELVISAIKQP